MKGAGEGGAMQSAAEIMREQLREVGIDLQLRPSDPAAWVETAFIKWDFDMTMGSFGTGPDPKIAVSRLYKTENIQRIPSANLMGYSNPKVDDLLTRVVERCERRPLSRIHLTLSDWGKRSRRVAARDFSTFSVRFAVRRARVFAY